MNTVRSTFSTSLAHEAELNKERAAGVGRTARTLELHLAKCAELTEEFRRASSVRRAGIVKEHAIALAEAKKWQWYLIVQREAIGVWDHEPLLRLYPLPAELK